MHTNTTCKICNNSTDNIIHHAREMMFGLRENFRYLECSNCGCLQLIDVPASMDKYYPTEYYSYHNQGEAHYIQTSLSKTIKRKFKSVLLGPYLRKNTLADLLVKKKYEFYYHWLRRGSLRKNSAILDVGCGNGSLLLRMFNDGFTNLTGADPYISKEIHYDCGITIYKKEVAELTQKFDLIMMHHAFEHMQEPAALLKDIYSALNPGGQVVIRIPVAGGYAWRKYGVNWVQLDAPRHTFIHSVKSMELLCKQTGFQLTEVMYDSYELQFSGSEKYMKDIPLVDESFSFTTEQIAAFNTKSAELNKINDGDAACFYLSKQ
jgi:2-polyprenyl-3-methyl-5-hydroxy-6-metoxy-1,4-benzoquinol methylase